mmetsp:Transcript_5085/g.17073  ORF Transcript_5085/g.17073 Transcript_5085/m.17073 type:complete len:483 (-) Transcript_5085:229-1677(-)
MRALACGEGPSHAAVRARPGSGAPQPARVGCTGASRRAPLLAELGLEEAVELVHRRDPCQDYHGEEAGDHRSACEDGASGHDNGLLRQGPRGLAQARPQHVDGRLPLELGVLVQGDIGHLLGGVEEGVLGGLGEHVLERAHADRREERLAVAVHVVEDDVGVEHEGEDADDHGRGQGADAPPEDLWDAAAHEGHHQRGGPHRGGVLPHEAHVLPLLRVVALEHGLPHDLGELDGEAVGEHEGAHEAEVLGAGEDGEGLGHGELGLGLLGLGGGGLGLAGPGLGLREGPGLRLGLRLALCVKALHGPKRDDHARARGGDEKGEDAEGVAVLVVPVHQGGGLPRGDGPQVAEGGEERVPALGLLHAHDVVRRLPEEERHAHGAKELRDDVVDGEGPVLHELGHIAEALGHVGHRAQVQGVPQRVEHQPEHGVEDDEGQHGAQEERPLAQHGGSLCVREEECHGGRDDKVHLEEGDGLGARRGDH